MSRIALPVYFILLFCELDAVSPSNPTLWPSFFATGLVE
jgi:hypothetical protein